LLRLTDYLDSLQSTLSFAVQDEDKVYVLNDLDDKNKPFTEAAATIKDIKALQPVCDAFVLKLEEDSWKQNSRSIALVPMTSVSGDLLGRI